MTLLWLWFYRTGPVLVMLGLVLFGMISPTEAVYASDESDAATLAWGDDFESFDDEPRHRDIVHPGWFKNSFLDLRDDLQDARDAGKKFLAVYYGQAHCAYCEAMMRNDFGNARIERFFRENFDIVAIDIWGDRQVTLLDGRTVSEKDWALVQETNFTPSLVFYDLEGTQVLKLRGYYPPYKFMAALEYLVDGFYRREPLVHYMERADPPARFDQNDLNTEDFFSTPPYALSRTTFPADDPLLVIFEQRNCHGCDVLHSEPLRDLEVRKLLEGFEVVQLDMDADTPILKPDNKASTAQEWARKLGIFFAPTLVFFDESGEEIIRIDSVVKLYRLRGVLEYVKLKGYEESPTYLRWREDHPVSR
ncbi:MAG: thioredoxin family protein [bacterium]